MITPNGRSCPPPSVDYTVYAFVPAGDWDAATYCAKPQLKGSAPNMYFSFWRTRGPITEKSESGRVTENIGESALQGGYARPTTRRHFFSGASGAGLREDHYGQGKGS